MHYYLLNFKMVEIKDISKNRVPFNWAQLIGILVFAITSTFTLTTIYGRFELTETNQKSFEEKLEIRYIEINDKIDFNDDEQTRRLNTKTSRNEDKIKELEKKHK